MEQRLHWDQKTNKCLLITQYEDNLILVEPISVKKASQWQAENRY